MCVAIVKPAGVEIGEKQIRNCFESNQDGAGFAVKKGEEILLKKGFFSADEFVKSIKENITKDDVAILHCRIATHGLKDAGNTHPFIVSKDPELLRTTEGVFSNRVFMVHNGIFHKNTPAIDEKVLSDSQLFIIQILCDKYILNGIWNSKPVQTMLSEYIGVSNKVALLHPKHGALYFGKFETFDGILYSNFSYTDKTYYGSKNYTRAGYAYNYDYLNDKDDDLDKTKRNNRLALNPPAKKDGYCDLCEGHADDIRVIEGLKFCNECYATMINITI